MLESVERMKCIYHNVLPAILQTGGESHYETLIFQVYLVFQEHVYLFGKLRDELRTYSNYNLKLSMCLFVSFHVFSFNRR
ncbi:hypothetical protein ABHD89_000251 [Salinicoccus halitifaciens]|uniref:Uncharacterized protein n=1 Tax=Salinicoccus halitifaciens TaxID=1073415 RepID=A0ABV2E621_9STAP